MPGMMESVATLNSAVRTALAVLVVGAAGVASWFGYTTYNSAEIAADRQAKKLAAANEELEQVRADLQSKSSELIRKEAVITDQSLQISKLGDELKLKEQEIQRLDTALRLLKVDHRLARLTVLDVADDRSQSTIQFVELNDEGNPIDQPKVFTLKGDMVYVDYWVVKFDDKYVEQSDLDRSTSICLFRRIFGEFQEPKDGYMLDEVGSRPSAYARGGRMSPFEAKIWADFWSIANDEARARAMGIRAAHGEAVSIKVEEGKSYRLLLRASDGLSIVVDSEAKQRQASAD